MSLNKVNRFRLLVSAAVLLTALPVLGQDTPESILPPGFGDPVEDPKPAARPERDEPVDVRPRDLSDNPSDGDRADRPFRPRSSSRSDAFPAFTSDALPSVGGTAKPAKDGEGDEEASAAPAILQDLPPQARRSLDRIGVLGINDGDMGESAFGVARGGYLIHLMRQTDAPLASRWASITLRRALLTRSATPANSSGSDFAAERAWLLVRMGEADSARLLVEAVDSDQYTPWMKTVAMRTSLANADPAGMCPAAEGHPDAGKDGFWMMARAVCSAFSGESSLASSLVDQVRDRDKAETIDVLLAEKVVGAAGNTRRAVNVLWENVSDLTPWRFGMATATGLKIPEALMRTADARIRAWRARAPLLAPADRTSDVELATALGVFSSAALVDHYSLLSDSADQAGKGGDANVAAIGTAFAGGTVAARIEAMKALWGDIAKNPVEGYARTIGTARAAAMIPVSSESSADADGLIASMMSAGLDVQASRWAKQVSGGGLGWALLAVGGPEQPKGLSASSVTGFQPGPSGKRAQFLLAGLAGLGRLSADESTSAAEDLGVPLGRQNAWTRALDRAAAGREPGTVALLVALGLQADQWKDVPPAQLFHAVAALRRVGLEAEARMIAAEAVMRS
jgi:hypothetical protein